MTAADDLVHVPDHPPLTATVRALTSAHRLTDRMLTVLLAISRGEVEADGTWRGRDRRYTSQALNGLRQRNLIDRCRGEWLLTVAGRKLVDRIGDAPLSADQACTIAAQQYDLHAEHCAECPPRVWDRPPDSCWRGQRLHLAWSVRQRAVWLALTERGVHS